MTGAGTEPRSDTPRAAFYCVSSDVYFLAAVGLVNSLRLVGHTEPIFVLDRGLEDEQRELLAREATVVAGTDAREPLMSKTLAPVEHPADVMVLVDADMIATRPLTDLIDAAAAGKVIGCETGLDRFFAEWGELLELGTARRHPYISSCLVALGGALGGDVVRLVDQRLDRVDLDSTYLRRNVPGYPFRHADEDVLNAVIATQAGPGDLVALDGRMAAAPPFEGLRVVNEGSLRCEFEDGAEPYVVHHWNAKPWLEPTHHGVYSRLLRRSLVGADVPIRVPRQWLPVRLRTGPLAYLERKRVNARERLRWHVGDPLSARVSAIRSRSAGGGT